MRRLPLYVLVAMVLLTLAVIPVQPLTGLVAAGAEAVAGAASQGDVASSEADEHGPGTAPEDGHASHGGPVVPVLLGLSVMLAAAKLGGEVFERLGQPAVLGELVMGIALGNLALVGWNGLEFLSTNQGIEILAQLGVILLLFEVGLESNIKEMMSVGWSSFLVAVLGVVAPLVLGWGVSAWLLPDEEVLVHAFIGATLCATSVGITARVLSDLGKIQTRESKIILGAAVIDDILGLVILAVVTGVIAAANTGSSLATSDILWILVKAVIFLVGAVTIGSWLSPRLFRLASQLRVRGILLVVALVFAFSLAYLADFMGLAAIVGAFAAGLILDEVHFRDFRDRGEHHIEELLRPLATFLVPIFFVWTGTRVSLEAFGHREILGFALVLSLVAIVGKMICALGVVERGLDRISVAVGMVPRGEVGLIFAGIGAGLMLHGHRVVSPAIFGAVVIMVIATTLITPPALKMTLGWGDARKARGSRGESRG